MDEAKNSDSSVLLLGCFEIKGKKHRVTLTSSILVWEPEGSPDFRQQVPVCEIVSVHLDIKPHKSLSCCCCSSNVDEDRTGEAPETLERPVIGLKVHMVERDYKHRWRLRLCVFRNPDKVAVKLWYTTLQALLTNLHQRPRRLLVFINPYGGKRKSPSIFKKAVQPLFKLAGITTTVVVTEKANHAYESVLYESALSKLDGIVCVGGDGMFNEVLNGLILRVQRDHDMDTQNPSTNLVRPPLRIGIIPGGSTDCVVYCTTGTNDPVTSTLHIILGDSVGIDVCSVHHENSLLKYTATMLAYGYLADTVRDSEKYRWMGPKRYDWSGFRNMLKGRAYEGELRFRCQPQVESSPRDNTRCNSGCGICKKRKEVTEEFDSSLENLQNPVWHRIKGEFVSINSAIMSCVCAMAPSGMSPSAHLGDGCTDLIVVRRCSRIDYIRYLYRSSLRRNDPYELDFVEVHRVREFQFRPVVVDDQLESLVDSRQSFDIQSTTSHSSSVWNCDGEIVGEPAVNVRVHCQLVRIFARGIEKLPQLSGCATYATSSNNNSEERLVHLDTGSGMRPPPDSTVHADAVTVVIPPPESTNRNVDSADPPEHNTDYSAQFLQGPNLAFISHE